MRAELWTERHGLVIRAGFMREEPKPDRLIGSYDQHPKAHMFR